MKKITLQTIAEHLGVSKALVSKALSNDPAVNEDTKETIWRTAEQLGYRIKSSKKQRAPANGGQIAALMPNMYLTDFEYWGELLRGIHDEAAKLGYNLVLAGIDITLSASDGMPAAVRERQVDGVIALGHIPEDYYMLLKGMRMPFVMADSNITDTSVDHVLSNNFWGAKEAVGRLLGAGHRHLAFVGDPESAFSFAERKRGFEAAVLDYRQANPGAEVLTASVPGMGVSGRGNYVSETFALTLKRLLEEDKPVTALFCANDMVALEALKLLAQWGIHCPRDVSVCGFDDLPYAEHANPRLSTMAVPRLELGCKAVQLVHRRIGEPAAIAELVLLPTTFTERDSIRNVIATGE